MEAKERMIAEKTCYLYLQDEAEFVFIQPVDEHDKKMLNEEVDAIRQLTAASFSLVAFEVSDWQSELTPWVAPPVFGKVPFGDGAGETLAYLSGQLLPCLKAEGIYSPERMKLVLGGYSLAGLFALWASYQTDLFQGIAAASPSVWYPGWIDYASAHQPQAKAIYLSLGDKEERTKNPLMSQVGQAIRRQQELLNNGGITATLEWNSGNHFVDAEKRMAKAFAWITTR